MTSFFSRDTLLKRQARISRAFTVSSPPESKPLNIIVEEDESRSSSPSSCYSVTSVKARRRHATVDIRLSRVLPIDDLPEDNDDLLSSPRPAPQPPTTTYAYSPTASPDSFRLTFTDASFEFPHPPIPTPTCYLRHAACDSPNQSSSSLSSSPGSQTEGMPLTPSTSDDEFGPSLTSRPVIQPLVITKHNPRPYSLFDDDYAISPSLLQPFKTPLETLTGPSAPLSPLSPSYLPQEFGYQSDATSDSEPESDSEWYTKELSKIISLRSPIPPCFSLQTPARPDSMSISSAEFLPSKRRVSKPLPPTPLSGGFPSPQLDPTFFPRRRASRRRGIPKYPPPPVPAFPAELSPTSPSSSRLSPLPHSTRRPPPRSSIPADCVYDLADAEGAEDSSSNFSFSIYDVYLGDETDGPDSPPSSYSQPSFDDAIDGVTFDLDYTMMLPLSLPATPFDLEADIAQGLEQLRNSPIDGQQPAFPLVTTDSTVQPETSEPEEAHQEAVAAEHPQEPTPQVFDDVFSSPFSPTFPSHSPTSPSYPYINEEKTLKSKWSTSTLGSIREEHERRGASAKLRLYFTEYSPLKSNKHASGSNTNSRSKKTSSTSPIPSLSLSPLGRKAAATASSPSAARSLPSKAHARGYSDVLVIGYGNNGGGGVRRRGSLANSVSDAGSEESYSSTSSSGLRRKPIPVEMFLRSAV
ncbi:hypothetical protein BYT27DRAFT_7243600 [Phlegmacium glaucopus]|nr:hypothetical protein BYT27DRAFT_7243600 [Phlegmacium glaucopus]